jgi:hypothetical protein
MWIITRSVGKVNYYAKFPNLALAWVNNEVTFPNTTGLQWEGLKDNASQFNYLKQAESFLPAIVGISQSQLFVIEFKPKQAG